MAGVVILTVLLAWASADPIAKDRDIVARKQAKKFFRQIAIYQRLFHATRPIVSKTLYTKYNSSMDRQSVLQHADGLFLLEGTNWSDPQPT